MCVCVPPSENGRGRSGVGIIGHRRLVCGAVELGVVAGKRPTHRQRSITRSVLVGFFRCPLLSLSDAVDVVVAGVAASTGRFSISVADRVVAVPSFCFHLLALLGSFARSITPATSCVRSAAALLRFRYRVFRGRAGRSARFCSRLPSFGRGVPSFSVDYTRCQRLPVPFTEFLGSVTEFFAAVLAVWRRCLVDYRVLMVVYRVFRSIEPDPAAFRTVYRVLVERYRVFRSLLCYGWLAVPLGEW